MEFKKVIPFLLAMVLIFTGCGGERGKKPNETSSQISTPEHQAKAEKYNPFTGEIVEDETSLSNRSIAIMVNNINIALPQRGISKADIIYELPVEGPITRLMAVYRDYSNIPEVGSIRSARHDFVELAKPFNPIYMHIGGSVAGKSAIAANKIDAIDGLTLNNVAFFQDQNRAKTKGREHSFFTNATLLKAGIDKKGINTNLESQTAPIFNFEKPDVDVMASEQGEQTNKASVKMSASVIATFTYDEKTGLYQKGQYGNPHIDENVSKACEVKNVLVMFTTVGLLPNTTNKEIDLSSGTGYYISNGQRIEVNFAKKSVDSPLEVFDLNGNPQKINAGNSWVVIAPKENKKQTIFS